MPRISNHFSIQDPRFGSLILYTLKPVTLGADANVTYNVAQLLGGMVVRPSITAARTDTLPAAGDLVEAIPGVMKDMAFDFSVAATGATLTIAAGAGGATYGVMTVATTTIKDFTLVFNNVGIGTEAYTVYSKGTAAA